MEMEQALAELRAAWARAGIGPVPLVIDMPDNGTNLGFLSRADTPGSAKVNASRLYAAGVSGLARSQGSMSTVLPPGVPIRKAAWPSHRTSVPACATTGVAVVGDGTGVAAGCAQAASSAAHRTRTHRMAASRQLP
mgnify:CR=1 FL=1